MACPRNWESPQQGWCIDPKTGNGYTAKEARRIYRERNGSNGSIWGDIIGGATDLTEILFGDGNTNDTVVVQQPQNNNWLWVGISMAVIILLLIFLIFR